MPPSPPHGTAQPSRQWGFGGRFEHRGSATSLVPAWSSLNRELPTIDMMRLLVPACPVCTRPSNEDVYKPSSIFELHGPPLVLAYSLLLLDVVMLSLDGLVPSACILCLVLVIVIMEHVHDFERKFLYISEAWVLSQPTPQSHQICVSSFAFAAICVLQELPNLISQNSACN